MAKNNQMFLHESEAKNKRRFQFLEKETSIGQKLQFYRKKKLKKTQLEKRN